MKIVFDISVLIDYLRGIKQSKILINKVRSKEIEGFISTVSEAELFAGKECGKENKRMEIEALTSLFTKINVDSYITQKAGELKRKYNVLLDDSIIAATAFVVKSKLWTKDVRDFEKIKEIEVEEPY